MRNMFKANLDQQAYERTRKLQDQKLKERQDAVKALQVQAEREA